MSLLLAEARGFDGLPSERMPEAEVALRLATYLLRTFGLSTIEVGIDGAQVMVGGEVVFPLAEFLVQEGWRQSEQRGRNPWTGTYHSSQGSLIIHSKSGVGDLVANLGPSRLIVECKKGPLVRKPGSPERPLLTSALGQALTFAARDGDVLAVAVPKTLAFTKLAEAWRERPLMKRAGIQIWLVGRDGDVEGCQLLGSPPRGSSR